MTVEELKAALDSGLPCCVLDVREAPELAVARYPFAVLHIPMSQIPARLDEIPTDRTIVCACRSGSRSAHIAAFLRSRGRDAVNLEGGILAWSARLDPSIPPY
jgi:rhodanese-related sulfurtransferase